MTTTLECRLYETVLEILFDIERSKHLSIVDLFYHFHRSSFRKDHVKPYALTIVTKDRSKFTLLFNDIIDTLHYIPSFKLKSNVSSDFAYVDTNNNLRFVSKTNPQLSTLVEYFKTSTQQEDSIGTNNIDASIIDDCKLALTSSEIEFTEDASYIHISNSDIHVAKRMSSTIVYKNVIVPSKLSEYDNMTCIGSFVVFDGKNTMKRSELNLALLNMCPECETVYVLNYEQGSTCPKCGNFDIL